jgi:hypothetical protein
MAFFSALIFDGAAASSAQAVPVPIASENNIAATTDDFMIMFSSHFLSDRVKAEATCGITD